MNLLEPPQTQSQHPQNQIPVSPISNLTVPLVSNWNTMQAMQQFPYQTSNQNIIYENEKSYQNLM